MIIKDLPYAQECSQRLIEFLTDCGWNVNPGADIRYQNLCQNDFIRIKNLINRMALDAEEF